MIKEYKEHLLKSLGVYELRELARNVGVASPTSKRRKQLEQEIMQISRGELAPSINKTKKGRPPKSIRKVESVLDIFVPKELLELTLNKKIDSQLEDLIQLNAGEQVFQGSTEMTGFLRKTVSGYFYFRNKFNTDELVSVQKSFVDEFKLLEGDKLTAVCKSSPSENYYILNELVSVNGQAPSKTRTLNKGSEIVLSQTNLKGFDGVNEGENVFLVTKGLNSSLADIKKVISSISPEYHIIVLASSVSTYIKLLLEKNADCEMVYSLVEDHPASIYDNVINVGNHVDVLLQEGKKVVVLVLDIFTMTHGIETFFTLENQKQTAQERIEAVRIAKKLFNYGKVLESGASVSVLGHCLESETEDELYKNHLSKLADKVFFI